MGKVKRPHMVTKGYLAAWADERNVVEVFDIRSRDARLSSINDATVVGKVYEPAVLTRDLEADYARIEDAGVPALVKIRTGQTISREEQTAVIVFLDMHLHRGRYADRAGVRVPAVKVRLGGKVEDAELTLGDMLILTHQREETLRLDKLGLEDWPWGVTTYPEPCLITGDGAVLLWAPEGATVPVGIGFPLSPTQLLVIGEDLPDGVAATPLIESRCRRWIIAARGTFRLRERRYTRTPSPSPAETSTPS